MLEQKFQKYKKVIYVIAALLICGGLFTVGLVMGRSHSGAGTTATTSPEGTITGSPEEGVTAGEHPTSTTTPTATSTATPTATATETPTPEPTPEPELKTYSTGYVAVNRDNHMAILEENVLIVYENQQEIARAGGNINQYMIMTDAAVYYVKNQENAGAEIYSIPFANPTETLIATTPENIQFQCMVGDSICGLSDKENDGHGFELINVNDGSINSYKPQELDGDVEVVEAGGSIYYSGGRTDVTAVPLYRFTPGTDSESEAIDATIGAGLYAMGDDIYYIHADSPDGSYILGTQTARKFSTTTMTNEDLVSGTYEEMGSLSGVSSQCLIFNYTKDSKTYLHFWNLSTKQYMNIPDFGKETMLYLGTEKGLGYFASFDYVSGDTKEYKIYTLNPQDGQINEINTIAGYPVSVTDGYIVMVKNPQEWNVYTKVAIESGTAIPQGTAGTSVPSATGGSTGASGGSTTTTESSDDYILPDSDKKAYQKSDLANLSAWDLRVARNEIYARHGYIFNNAQLKAYFEGKPWYHGTTSSATTVDGQLNSIERANIAVIESCEAQ